ncbi:unnamed protein product [Moneuplotes crassus]|uniref:Uncharacterized protein n=1 Tax=Euplotes crassus TaxID=5936 RepID=A0AAD1Y838_EUPCR|nr:unnamed protein product [Moneuplotes crassus]
MAMKPISCNLGNLEYNLNEDFKPTAITSCKAKKSIKGPLPLFRTDSKGQKNAKKPKLEGAKSKRELNQKALRLISNRPSSTKKINNIKMTKFEGNKNHIDRFFRDNINQANLSKSKLRTSYTSSSKKKYKCVNRALTKAESQPYLTKKGIFKADCKIQDMVGPGSNERCDKSKIPKNLVNKLVGVLKDSEKCVKKNRKSSSIENQQMKHGFNERYRYELGNSRTPTAGVKAFSSLKRPSQKKENIEKNSSMICIHSSYTNLNKVNMVNVDPGQNHWVNFYSLTKKSAELCKTNDRLNQELNALGDKMKRLLTYCRVKDQNRRNFLTQHN